MSASPTTTTDPMSTTSHAILVGAAKNVANRPMTMSRKPLETTGHMPERSTVLPPTITEPE